MQTTPTGLGSLDARNLDDWNGAIARVFGDIQVAARERGFHASMRHRSWGGLGLSSVDSVPARVAGATRLRRGRPAPPGCFVLLNERGPCRVEQAGRDVLLEAGELTLIRRDEPYRISFDEPNRTHAVLGRALGVSARWVQLAFARRGTTLGAHLLEQRLQRAARRLAGPDGVPVGRLALELGFNELSHFCRSFRRRFGCSARDWRAGRTPR